MNVFAGGEGNSGSVVRRSPLIAALLVVATWSATDAKCEDFVLPDGSAAIADGSLEAMGDGLAADPSSEAFERRPAYQQWLAEAIGSTGPRWDLAVDALMLWQANAQSLPLFLDGGGATVFDAQQLGTEMAAGPRVSLIRAISECHAIEGNYFQVRPFNAGATIPANGGPYQLANMGDIVSEDIGSAMVASSGWIQSAELNLRKNVCRSPITWIAGFRWVELNSQINADYTFANPGPYESGNVAAAGGNNLYGGQAGADVRLWNRGGNFWVNGIGKAGVFYNSAAYQRSTAGFVTAGGDPIPLGTVSATADQTAFFGEVGVNSTYWITPWLAWRAGYSFFWASGVAVAAQQLPLNNFGEGTTSINTNGSVLLHGVTTGVEARW